MTDTIPDSIVLQKELSDANRSIDAIDAQLPEISARAEIDPALADERDRLRDERRRLVERVDQLGHAIAGAESLAAAEAERVRLRTQEDALALSKDLAVQIAKAASADDRAFERVEQAFLPLRDLINEHQLARRRAGLRASNVHLQSLLPRAVWSASPSLAALLRLTAVQANLRAPLADQLGGGD